MKLLYVTIYDDHHFEDSFRSPSLNSASLFISSLSIFLILSNSCGSIPIKDSIPPFPPFPPFPPLTGCPFSRACYPTVPKLRGVGWLGPLTSGCLSLSRESICLLLAWVITKLLSKLRGLFIKSGEMKGPPISPF